MRQTGSEKPQDPALDRLLQEARVQLLDQLRAGSPDPAQLARALHLSERTMRRRLQAAGTRYQELLDGLRTELAQESVRQGDLDIGSLTQRLGFTDPSAFYRAFKRWTGMTPQQYQRHAREQA